MVVKILSLDKLEEEKEIERKLGATHIRWKGSSYIEQLSCNPSPEASMREISPEVNGFKYTVTGRNKGYIYSCNLEAIGENDCPTTYFWRA